MNCSKSRRRRQYSIWLHKNDCLDDVRDHFHPHLDLRNVQMSQISRVGRIW